MKIEKNYYKKIIKKLYYYIKKIEIYWKKYIKEGYNPVYYK